MHGQHWRRWGRHGPVTANGCEQDQLLCSEGLPGQRDQERRTGCITQSSLCNHSCSAASIPRASNAPGGGGRGLSRPCNRWGLLKLWSLIRSVMMHKWGCSSKWSIFWILKSLESSSDQCLRWQKGKDEHPQWQWSREAVLISGDLGSYLTHFLLIKRGAILLTLSSYPADSPTWRFTHLAGITNEQQRCADPMTG